jgi:hypothetical protein
MESWAEMEGGPTQRHCERCDKDIYNLSAMTRRQARSVLARRAQGQRLCVRYIADAQGQVEFRRETLIPPALLLRGRQLALGAGLSAAVLGGCLPAGSAVGSAAAHQAADELGERGFCSVSLEPLFPVSLTVHAIGCAPGPSEPAVLGQLAVPLTIPQVPVPPTPSPPLQIPSADPAVHRTVPKLPHKREPKPAKKHVPSPPEVFMGDIME